MRIAVDMGACSPSGGGISRYVECMLGEMHGMAPADQWLLYGRGGMLRAYGAMSGVAIRSDGLPHDAGRIASLVTSLPCWSAIDRPDIFWGPAHRLPAWLPASTARVVTIHDLCWIKAPQTMRAVSRRLDASFMPRAIRQADKVIAVSSATARDFERAFPQAAAKVVVVAEGVSPLPEPHEPAALRAAGIDGPYVLFVGTLEPRKNLDRLLEAYAAVQRDNDHCDNDHWPGLVIAGAPGWGGRSLESRCAELGLGAKVRILGRVDDKMLATLYRHALFLAMPSLYEGFGLPLVEAMSQGRAVLTSQNSSMPEVAGPAGLLVDPLSTESIAQGFKQMVQDTALREKLAGAAVAQAKLFSWTLSARATLEVMRQAVAQRAMLHGAGR